MYAFFSTIVVVTNIAVCPPLPYLQVCGSDGVTYESICQMNYQAAVRMDYEGECVQSNISIEDGCKQVVDANLCSENPDSCSALVFPVDSCCPICGKFCFSILIRMMCNVLPWYYMWGRGWGWGM